MSLTSQQVAQLHEWASDATDGTITAEGFNALAELLQANESARRLYSELFSLNVLLADALAEQPVAQPSKATTNASTRTVKQSANAPKLSRRGFAPRNWLVRRPLMWSTCAVGCAFLIYIAVLTWNMRAGALPNGVDGEGSAVAKMFERSNVRWSSSTPQNAPSGDFTFGEELAIDSGSVELQLRQGATLIIEGPAAWQIDGTNYATLKHGKLLARVPRQAIGFTVDTPSARVIDLGTEFTVEADIQGKTNVQVIKGEVEAQSKSVGSPNRQTAKLTAGQSVRVDAQGNPQFFERSADGSVRPLANVGRKNSPAGTPIGTSLTSPIYLGNLFDDNANVTLAQAMTTDKLGATAREECLGIDTVAIGGPARKKIAFGVEFDFSNLGWTALSMTQPANDALGASPIRTLGNARNLRAAKVEEGIGMHANMALTFSINELREAGRLADRPLRFVCDRAGVNDGMFGNADASLYMVVLQSSRKGVQTAWLNGKPAEVVVRGGIAQLEKPPVPILKADGTFFPIDLSLSPDTAYLTLAIVQANANHHSDHAVWSGARIEIDPPAPDTK